MTIEVTTRQYQFAHGKQPRGWGMWGFFFDGNREPFWHTGEFADARRSAVAYAVTKGHRTVEVAP